MKYFLLLCFLLAFSISKLPTESDYSSLSEDSCTAAESKDQCLNIELDEEDSQCCYMNGSFDGQEQKVCSSFMSPFPITELSNIMKTSQFKPFTKEVLGYMKYSSSSTIPSIPEGKAQLTCKEGTIDIDIGGDEYSEDDIKILKSENYCLNYTMSTFMQVAKTPDCKNAKLLQSSKDARIECGDLALNFEYGGSKINMKTCMLFSFDMFSKITLSAQYKELLNQYIKENMGAIDKFSIELSDSKGRKFIFNSEKGIIIDDNNNIDEDKKDNTDNKNNSTDNINNSTDNINNSTDNINNSTDDKNNNPDDKIASNYSSVLNISKYFLIISLFLF